MSSKLHYFAVGMFVLIAMGLGVAGVIIFGSSALNSPKYFIETYVDESIQGIEIGTPFKFRGVEMGRVSEIALVSQEYDTSKMYVMIRVAHEINEYTADPDSMRERVMRQISEEGLRLQLVPQGITGLSFLEADFYPDASMDDLLEVDWEPKYHYIPSTPALMTKVSRSVERITAQVDTIDFEQIGADLESIMDNLNSTVLHIEAITADAADVSDEITQNLQVSSANLTAMVDDLRKTVHDSDADVGQILTNLRFITEESRELIRMIKRTPSMLLTEPPEKKLSR
jgi:paraquat-inducible protein B